MTYGEMSETGEKMSELMYNKPWILQRADTYVYRHTDGSYYFTASVPAYDESLHRDITSFQYLGLHNIHV